jgi:hypothetical protein
MLKKGKEEIVYLLTRCIEKFQLETNQPIIQNTNRKNYESLAARLSEISNRLPETASTLNHQPYDRDLNPRNLEYPFRKYDITGGQIKDALMGFVANPRSFLVDTCYIYLFGVGRQAFEANPTDPFLVQQGDAFAEKKDSLSLYQENQLLKLQLAQLQQSAPQVTNKAAAYNKFEKWLWPAMAALAIMAILTGIIYYRYQHIAEKWDILKTDFNLLPYSVTEAERKQLEGIWICYTGSPQARLSDSNRYHKVVANLIQIDYKDGYFLYNRFGASFNHIGYIQFEAPGLLSIHSRVKNDNGKVESPRHSLMMLDSTGTYLSAISASWNFDVGDRNRIIGIREAYQKLGSGGKLEEVINSLENASCQCKIIRWRKPNDSVSTYYLKNISLDALKDSSLLQLINEHSILTKNPSEKLVIEDSQD